MSVSFLGGLTGEHGMSGVADEDEPVLVPFRNRAPRKQLPEFHVFGFPEVRMSM